MLMMGGTVFLTTHTFRDIIVSIRHLSHGGYMRKTSNLLGNIGICLGEIIEVKVILCTSLICA